MARIGIELLQVVRVDALKQAAEANPIDEFQMVVFRQVAQSLFIERMDTNEELFANYMNEAEFQEVVAQWLGQRVYERLPKTIPYGGKRSVSSAAR